jgi:hypothetical protein
MGAISTNDKEEAYVPGLWSAPFISLSFNENALSNTIVVTSSSKVTVLSHV